MPVEVPFPYITPSKREYSPGVYPTKFFEAINGSTTAIRYGNRRSKSKLSLSFQGVKEEWAIEILECYEKCMEQWGYIRFNRGDDGIGGRGGAWEGVQEQKLIENWYQENFVRASQTYWRFESPPTVTTLYPGTVTIDCQFISYLDPD